MKFIQGEEKEQQLINYSEYKMTFKWFVIYAIVSGVFFSFIGYLFYKNAIVALLFSGLGLFYPKTQKKRLLEKRKDELKNQFKQAIIFLSSSLAAGRSIENSFREVIKDLRLLYPDPNTFIIREIELINRRVENGVSIEKAIDDLSVRADIEDISNFAEVFITCKRTGGNLVEVIRKTANIISEKLDIQQEIKVLIAQKRFESKALNFAAIAMITLLSYTAGDYMQPLYEWKHFGPIIMTVCLLLLTLSYWLSQRIMNIKV